MDVNKLVMMVNQIEKNIAFAGEKSEVIATHIKKFWTPAMRTELFAEIKMHPDNFSLAVRNAFDLLHNQAKA